MTKRWLAKLVSTFSTPSRLPKEKEDFQPFKEFIKSQRLKPGDIAIDCGAGVGEITEVMAMSGAQVFAFEPNPYAYQVLCERLAQYPNVQLINKGVHTHNGASRLYLHKQAAEDPVKWSTASSLLVFKRNINPQNFVEIELIDLAQFILHLQQDVKVLKMDVEGIECPIVNHLIDSGAIQHIRHLLVETHDQRIPELKEETDALRLRIQRERRHNINLDWY
ncbi:MAG: FkbM family methyltransferase [Anaerolineae bacterium]|nr:FkbM family methyltransferase [Anaerolineae bacterium]